MQLTPAFTRSSRQPQVRCLGPHILPRPMLVEACSMPAPRLSRPLLAHRPRSAVRLQAAASFTSASVMGAPGAERLRLRYSYAT